MADMDTLREMVRVGDYIDYASVSDDTTGSNLFSSDVDVDKTHYPIAMIISDTSGADNSVAINEVRNNDTTETIHATFNVASSATETVGFGDGSLCLPPVDGGENLEFVAASDGIDVTVLYFTDEV